MVLQISRRRLFLLLRTFTFNSLTDGTTYEYRVTSIGACGDGGTSAIASFYTRSAPVSPTNVVSSDPGCNGFTLNWAAVADADRYEVELSTDGFTSFTTHLLLPKQLV